MLAKGLFIGCMLASLAVGAANAQTPADIPGPAELPPIDYPGSSYVDSRGCVFLRAGYGGRETWVPRVTTDRKPLCGYAPTEVASTRPAPVEPVAEPVAEPAEEPAPVPSTAPAEAPADTAPSVASTTSAAAAPIEPAPPEPAAQDPAPAPVAAAPAAPTTPPPEVPLAKAADPSVGPAAVLAPRRAAADAAPVPKRMAKPSRKAAAAKPARTGRDTKSPGTHVQVGSYAVPANAIAARKRLQALGLPTGHARMHWRGKDLTVIFAGPFADSAARQNALAAIRAAGFADAFIR